MTDEVLSIDPERYKTNADIILAAAEMGYITGVVLDATYGTGAFWKKYRPPTLSANDLDLEVRVPYHYDFRALPERWANLHDTSVLDPPYKLDGTPGQGGPAEANIRFGVADGQREYESTDEVMRLYEDGLYEMHRVTKVGGHILVKCMDQVAGMQTRWQSWHIANIMRKLGDRYVTTFFLIGSRKQPAGREQRNVRNNYSQLLVFRRGGEDVR